MSSLHRSEKRKRALQPLAVNTFNANVHGTAAAQGKRLVKRGQKPGMLGKVADKATRAVDVDADTGIDVDVDVGRDKRVGMTVDPFDASTSEEHVVARTRKKPRTVTFAKQVIDATQVCAETSLRFPTLSC